jgi:hypothetical protein
VGRTDRMGALVVSLLRRHTSSSRLTELLGRRHQQSEAIRGVTGGDEVRGSEVLDARYVRESAGVRT